MIKINNFLKIFYIISILCVFFDGFVIVTGPFMFRLTQIICPAFMLTYFILYKKKAIGHFLFLHKKTPLKYLTYFVLWLFIDAFILLTFNIVSIRVFYDIIFKTIMMFIFPILLIIIGIPRFLSLKQALKIFYLMAGFIFLVGIILFFGEQLSISFLHSIQNFVSNLHYQLDNTESITDASSNLTRLRSIFHEPGALASYIFVWLPIFYSISLSKNKLFDSKTKDSFIKIFVLVSSLVCLVLAQSPIYLIFAILISIAYFFRLILSAIKKHFTLFICLFLPLIISIILLSISDVHSVLSIDVSGTFLSRITKVFEHKDFESMVLAEGSLGTRIVSFINLIIFYFKSKILMLTGYGISNSRFYTYEQFMYASPIALTPELITNLTVKYSEKIGASTWICGFTFLLCETGLIGFALFYSYLIRIIKRTKKLPKYFSGIEYDFINGLNLSLIAVLTGSIYLSVFYQSYLAILLGFPIVLSFLFICKTRK